MSNANETQPQPEAIHIRRRGRTVRTMTGYPQSGGMFVALDGAIAPIAEDAPQQIQCIVCGKHYPAGGIDFGTLSVDEYGPDGVESVCLDCEIDHATKHCRKQCGHTVGQGCIDVGRCTFAAWLQLGDDLRIERDGDKARLATDPPLRPRQY